jgi:hypothetical protein
LLLEAAVAALDLVVIVGKATLAELAALCLTARLL